MEVHVLSGILTAMLLLGGAAITLTGSLWVMYHMNANMMPGMDPSQLP